jgi:hypothetical protein
MFHATDLAPDDDRAPLAAVQAVFIRDAAADRFMQPCPAAVGGRCTMHEARPSMCRTYACDLLRAVEEGTLAEHDARQVVDRALALRDQVRPALEELTGRPDVAARLSTDPSAPAAHRLTRRSIPGLHNALQARIGTTRRDELPSQVRAVLDDADALLALLTDRFGLGR